MGKSRWLEKLIRNRNEMFSHSPPNKFQLYYGCNQPLYDEMSSYLGENIEFFKDLDTAEIITERINKTQGNDDSVHIMLIFDDLQYELTKRPDLTKIFSAYTHHLKVTCAFLTHNLFAKGVANRDVTLNSQYLVLMRSMRDISSINVINRQVFTGKNPKFLLEAYTDSVLEKKYGYLVVDLQPSQYDESLRVRTDIWPGDTVVVYTSK